MKKREFNAALKSLCSTEGRSKTKRSFLDLEKVRAAPDDLKTDLVRFIAGSTNRSAGIVKEMIPPSFDMGWLAAMGYLYHASDGNFDFLCTGESPLLLKGA